MNIDETKKQIKDDAFWQDMEIASGETTRIPVEDIRRFASAHAADDTHIPDASRKGNLTNQNVPDSFRSDDITNRRSSDTASSDRTASTDAPSNSGYTSDMNEKKTDTKASAQSTQTPKNSGSKRVGSKKSDSKKSGSKKSKKKGSGLTSLVKSSAMFTQKTVSTGGSLLKGSARLSGTVARSGFRLVTLALILLTMALLSFHFWKNYSALGSLRSMLSERNYSLAAYLCVGILLILFEVAALLRAATSKKIRDGKRIFTYDTGRGMFSFPIIYIGSCLALRFCEHIPMLHPSLSGVQSALRVYGSLSQTLLAIGCLGVVSCLLRWGFSRVLLSVRNHDDE